MSTDIVPISYDPVERNPSNYQVEEIWSDLDHRLIVDPKGNIKKAINIESVKTSIHNILHTYPMQRVMLPTFASNINNLLFEPISEDIGQRLNRDIKEAIETWDNRVIVNAVKVTQFTDQQYVEVFVSYSIIGFSQIFENKFSVKQAS